MEKVKKVPKYRRHKPSGQAVVTIGGKDQYLGKYGSAESKQKYDRLLAEWLSSGRTAIAQGGEDGDVLTVVELIRSFWRHVRSYYRKNGKPTSEQGEFKRALAVVKRLYGNVPVTEFGPVALKAVRERMAARGWCRYTVNRRIQRVRRMFRWGVAEELVPANVLHALQAVEDLKFGRTEVKEAKPVRPVDDEVVNATLKHVPPTVGDMIRFQRATGCRPGEVCVLRPMDLDRAGDVWLYRPSEHKLEHHGRERVVPIGPTAQRILTPYMDRDETAYCFSPAESEKLRRIDQRRRRKSKVQPSQQGDRRRKRRPKKHPGEKYTAITYRRAIHRACEKAGVEKWAPNRLRHTAATAIRQKFGLEAAQVALGHKTADVTQIYAERDLARAVEVAREMG